MSDDSLEQHARAITEAVPDANLGLPDPVFYMVSRLVPQINVDLLIRDERNRVLMTWRADRFYGPGWHLPGGIIRFKEFWQDRIAKTAQGELGVSVHFKPMPIAIRQPMNLGRDVRGHFISMLFDCSLASEPDPARGWDGSSEPEDGQWAWVSGTSPDIIPAHKILYTELLADLAGQAGEPAPPGSGRDYVGLSRLLDHSHELIRLARRIDWTLPGVKPDPAQRLRLGLHLLGILKGLRDDDLCAQWLENPYFQAFCGGSMLEHTLSVTPDELAAWRAEMGAGRLAEFTARALPASDEKPRTFVIDVDGVVAMLTPGNDYRLCRPIVENIEAINRLYDQGHRIIMMTARGSATGIDWDGVTRDQFASWGLKFHELRFGKPAADHYVDDRALSVEMMAAMAAGRPFPPSTRAPRLSEADANEHRAG